MRAALPEASSGALFAIGVVMTDSLGQLERSLIDEFLRARGIEPGDISALPEHDRKKLLAEASVYASGKLVEVEARAQYSDQIHDDAAIAALAPSHGNHRLG